MYRNGEQAGILPLLACKLSLVAAWGTLLQMVGIKQRYLPLWCNYVVQFSSVPIAAEQSDSHPVTILRFFYELKGQQVDSLASVIW
jgi:hypothetical protein